MTKRFHLFETLYKMGCLPEKDGAIVQLNEESDIAYLDDTYQERSVDPPILSSGMSGWMKYRCFYFDQPLTLHHKSYVIRNILHLMHSSESDIIICRVVKFSKKDNKYAVKYVVQQRPKEQICGNINEMNSCLKNAFQYDGRPLVKTDFDNEVTK